MLMHAYGYIKQNPEQATDLYTRQCSVGVTAKDLATMAATLAFGGRNPVTGKQAISAENVPYVLAVMATAGLYDDSGKWLYHTGLPAKSGVGGGIIAVAPGKFGIAVVSPPLDEAGNSIRAQKAITDIVNALGLNPARRSRLARWRRRNKRTPNFQLPTPNSVIWDLGFGIWGFGIFLKQAQTVRGPYPSAARRLPSGRPRAAAFPHLLAQHRGRQRLPVVQRAIEARRNRLFDLRAREAVACRRQRGRSNLAGSCRRSVR